MPAAAETATTRYSAFLSYSHADAPFVRRLHRRLESYRLPGRLRRGRPGKLDRIFMDRAELIAAPSLTQSVRDAISLSGHMIVVCSPASAASDWVGREIALFKQLHGASNLLAALYRGDVNVSFHPELLGAGEPGDPREPPIAADFRKDGDGFRLALLKLIAPLHGVELDQLIQRDAQRQIRRVVWSAAASVAGVCVAGALTVLTLQAQIEAEREHARSGRMVDRLIGEERARLKSVGRLDMLRAISRDAMNFFSGRDASKLSNEDKNRQAKLLQEMADDDIKRGDYRSAEGHVGAAMQLTSALLSAEPSNPRVVYGQAQSEYWFGYLRLHEGDETSALAGMRNYATLAYRLTALEPANLDYRLERAYANSILGTFVLRRNIDTRRAGALFRAAQADFESVEKLRPEDRDLRIQAEDGYAWLADVSRLSGDYVGALNYRLYERSLIEALVATDPRDAQARGRLVVNDLALGRIAAARGDPQGALAYFRTGQTGALALADMDPENLEAAQEVRAIELFEARTLLTAPRSQRPSNTEIDALIGDCNANKTRPNHAELAQFCALLRRRLLAQEGGQRQVSQSSTSPVATSAPGDRLSERWLIDWQSENAVR
jgi:MTH538 TIR-like domain (DUF1863)